MVEDNYAWNYQIQIPLVNKKTVKKHLRNSFTKHLLNKIFHISLGNKNGKKFEVSKVARHIISFLTVVINGSKKKAIDLRNITITKWSLIWFIKIWSKNLVIFQVTSFKQNWSTVRDKLDKNLKAIYQKAESRASLWLSLSA